MFGIFGRDTQISLQEAFKDAGQNGYELSFTAVPSEVQTALTLLSDERRKKDGAKKWQVENTVFIKEKSGSDGNQGPKTYKLKCITMGKQRFSYYLCVKQGSDGKILDKFVEVVE